jgi:cysteinyl-tRNA synthetase
LQGAARGYERLLGTVMLVRQQLARAANVEAADPEFLAVIEQHQSRFLTAMDNDFNTPQALAALFDFNKAVNSLINRGQPVTGGTLEAIDQTYRTLGGNILGLIPEEISTQEGTSAGLEESLIQILIDLRAAARKNKDFGTADAIRDQLMEIGVSLEDRPDGTIWKISQR